MPPTPPPYHVTASEAGKSPVALFVEAIKRVLPDAFDLTPTQLAETLSHTQFDRRPLHQQGFWNLLLDLLSSEAYQFIFDSYGVESAFSNWNAEAAIDLLVTIMSAAWHNPDQTTFYTLPDGLSTLPLTLARRFEELGGAISRIRATPCRRCACRCCCSRDAIRWWPSASTASAGSRWASATAVRCSTPPICPRR